MKTKRLTKKQKTYLYTQISNAVHDHFVGLSITAEALPFSSTSIGKTKVVTLDAAGYSMNKRLLRSVENILRES